MEEIVGGVGESSSAILDLGCDIAPRLASAMICGCGELTLKEAFPDLDGIACAKDALVAAQLEISGVSNQWNASFARGLMTGMWLFVPRPSAFCI